MNPRMWVTEEEISESHDCGVASRHGVERQLEDGSRVEEKKEMFIQHELFKMRFDPAFRAIAKYNLSRAIMPPQIRGVPFLPNF